MTDPAAPVLDAPGEDPGYQRTLLVVVMLSVMGFGSLMTIVTVSLGLIADDLGTSRATLTWVVTGLMLAMAVATPLAGKLGDLHGHRRLFLLGLVGGVVTTVLCALAWDAPSLIAFRVLFGLTGALVMPNGMALMMHAYGPARRSSAMGWFQFAMTGAPTIGLVLGGPVIELIGWRWMFVAFAVVALVASGVGWRLVRPGPRRSTVRLDVWGALFLGAAVLAGLLAITRFTTLLRDVGAGRAAIDALAWALVAGCGAAVVLFVRAERRAPSPMIKLTYFSRRNFVLPMTSSALVQFAYMGGFVVTPALLGSAYGWGLGTIALLLAVRPAVFSVSSPAGGYLAEAIGLKPPIAVGAAAMVVSMVAFAGGSAVTSGAGLALVTAGLAFSGLAAGISQPAVATMVVETVDVEDMGIANGMSQQVMFIGIVTGIQSMNVLIGDDATSARFVGTFTFGAVVALGGLVAALAIDSRRLAH